MTIKAQPEMLRVAAPKQDKTIGVDREQRAILGYVVAEEGNFKSKGRGRFDVSSLMKLVELGNADPMGVRQRFQHPTASDDGLGKYVGRASNFRLDKRDGRTVVRADSFIDKTAMKAPVNGGTPYGEYLMDLAESDPGALQTSIVVEPEKIKSEEQDELGEQLPPLWIPKHLHASDFVDTGDAVHGDLLSGDTFTEWLDTGSDRRIPAKLPVVVTQYLDRGFADADREAIETRFQEFLGRYLDGRFGPLETSDDKDLDMAEGQPKTDPAIAALTESLKETNERVAKLAEAIEGDHLSRTKQEQERNRAAEIAALCKLAGNDQAEQFIADEKLSVEAVTRKLFSELAAKQPKVGDDAGDEVGTASDPVSKLRQEYDSKSELLKRAGYHDRETWVKHQCRDRGIEYKAAA